MTFGDDRRYGRVAILHRIGHSVKIAGTGGHVAILHRRIEHSKNQTLGTVGVIILLFYTEEYDTHICRPSRSMWISNHICLPTYSIYFPIVRSKTSAATNTRSCHTTMLKFLKRSYPKDSEEREKLKKELFVFTRVSASFFFFIYKSMGGGN
ncbi:unnamed protein product [Acanthosepion pharaonis]|uniref:Uncharacterized protein n=1 Tax=Acanthosepion pharaonis TaxID=158019 RepID=A0A812C8S3_ACAPH|nr:unnamed protein product [Sepia pharaonis]